MASSAGRNPMSARERQARSEEHTSELQSQSNLVCRLLLEKKNNDRSLLFRFRLFFELLHSVSEQLTFRISYYGIIITRLHVQRFITSSLSVNRTVTMCAY